ncbi:unnamed protein product [Calicophoron daubneyi]|uniref:Dystrophin n=1 Tax=Calicophoron daubneyi TaxID=300641 RepID=A0AAV2TV16_CALDB
MIQEPQVRKQYPSECITEDLKRLETQIRVLKRWLNTLLKQANAREVTDVLDIFRDTKNFYALCKFLAGQKLISIKESTPEDASYLDRATSLLEKLYGHEISSVMQTAATEIIQHPSWESEAQLRPNAADLKNGRHNLLLLGLDSIWIFIVAVRAGTGPPANLTGSVSSSGSTLTRRSLGSQSIGQSHLAELTCVRTPCVDRWLVSQDERLMAWCIAVTEGYSGLNICNFTHSWRDGLAFLAVAHQSRPDLFAYETRLEKTANQNLSLAFHLATSEFATPRLLEPMDMHPDCVDARATATYVLELRKAIERDRKRRSRGILEIQTTAMTQEQAGAEPDESAVNVTVLSRSSPTSSVSTSEITWLDEEFDEDSGDEGKPSLPDPEMFDSMIETTLAWLLAMEERFANNDLTKYDTNLQIDNFHWTGYSQEDLRKNLSRLTHLSTDEKNDVEALLTLSGERLKKLHNKILSRVDEAMSHFETHEDLTAHLSRRQMAVGRCLRLGAKLIQTCRDRSQLEKADETDNNNITVDVNELDKEEQNRIRQLLLNLDPEIIQRQTALLATRWNNLCRANQTMGRRITTCLLRRQGMLLIAIRLQLEKLEAEQSRQAELPIGPSIRELKSQLEVNRSLEEGIEIGEILAERLDNFITLVPMRPAASERDSDAEKEKSLESIIGELATRWSRLVEWVNTRYAKLQNALLHWRHFEEEANVLSDWLNEVSEEVSKETAKATAAVNSKRPFDRTDSAKQREEEHQGQTANQTAAQERLQSVLAENDAEIEAVEACLATHESRWAQLLASLDRRAQSLREACGDTEEVSRLVEATVDQLVSKWSQLAEPQISTEDWVDHCANEMANYSELAQSHREGEQDGESAETVSEVRTKHAPPAHLNVPKASASTPTETAAAQPPSPTGYRADFESKAEELLNWLENSVEALELITMDKKRALEATGQAQAVGRKVSTQVGTNAENPVSVIARISKEMAEWRDTMKHVMSMGERYREELLQVGENVEELDQLFDEVEEHWGYLDTLLIEAERQVRVATRSAEFQQEAAKIHELLSKSQESSEPKKAVAKTSDLGNGETPATSDTPASTVPANHGPANDYTEHVSPILEQLNNQLSKVREVLSSPLLFANPDDFDDQLVNTKNLARDVEDEQTRFLNVVAKRGKDVNKNSKIEMQVEAMRTRLESTCNELKSRVAVIQDLNEQLEFFMNQFEGIEKWLTDMRDYLDSVSQANLPSITVIQAQLQESCEALNDMQTLEPTLKKVNDVAKQLITYFKPDYEKILRNRLSALHSNWEQVRILTKSNRDHLESLLAEKIAAQEVKAMEEGGGEEADATGRMTSSVTGKTSRTPECTSLPDIALSRASQLSSPEEAKAAASASRAPRGSTGNALTILRVNIDELEHWMSDAKKKLAEFSVIEAEKDLKFMENTINELSEGISERRYILAALDTHVAVGMLDQPLSDTESLLTRAHFADLESALGAERERVRAAAYHLEDFNTVLSAEQRWLDSVSNTLKRLEEGSYTDTSELSDDLENLDRLADEHSAEDVERLESLTGSLESANIMAQITKDRLNAYKDSLASTQTDIEKARTKYHHLLDKWQDFEAEANELESWLAPIGEKNDGVGNESEVAKKWKEHMKKTDDLLKLMNTQIEELDKEPGNTNLSNQFKECRTRIQDAYRALQQTMEHYDQSSDFEPRLTKVRREIGLIETQAYLLDIVSVSPQDIRTGLENAKDLMASLNEIKTDIDYVLNASKGQNKKGVEFPERLMHELPSLCERHKKLVMSVLLALERLENALPLAEKLDNLVTDLGQQLASVEEVTDYLETADCPVSRRDMIQRVSTTLNRLCNKDGLVDQIRETANRLKPFTVANTSDTAADYFREIEERLQRVTAAKKAFLSQLEEAKESSEEVTPSTAAVSAQAAPDKSVKREELKEIKPSPKKTIEHLIDPDAAVSPIVRELAREIRDHFRGIVLFNRFCLGTNIPLSSMKSDIRETTNTLNVNNSYPTTIAERMATVKLFQQQRTHLEDRLKELIVNAGANDSVDRLQDLLNLQGCWHETNDELDKRGEHMALLEQQLLTTDRTISDYLERPSESLRSKSVGQIKRLEETYDWNLSFDLERVSRRTDVSASATSAERKMEIPAEMRGGWLFNDPLIEQYEKTLETAARYLNDIQINLDCCRSGQMAELGSLIGRIDSKFVDCCQLLASAADVLDRLTTRGGKPELPYRSRRGEKLSERATTPDDIVWLKVLLDTQKNRLESYSTEFKTNRSNWQKRSEQWKTFCRKLESLKSLLSGWSWPPEDSKKEPNEDLLDKLSVACKHYVALNRQGLELVQTEFFSESTSAGESKVQSSNEHPDPTVPPAVPPRKNSLRRGHNVVSGEEDRDFIQNELNNLRSQLIKLCQKYRCQHLLEASSDQITTAQAGVQNGLQARPKSAEQKSSYVNVDWLDDEVQPLNLSTLESLGPYKTEVEACLRGLANESRWFVQDSGLVPASLLRRKSDDILLASAGRKKPTSPAEIRLDFCFWHGYTDDKGEKKEEGEYVEFTPNWLKSKWAELEHLIEVTFEHEKRANNWTRKATQLAKILRENEVAKTSALESRIVARLEAGCHNATEAISLAQTALKRRKTTLTRWQSDLVLLDTMLAQIKTVMGSYDVGRFGIKGETPDCWLADLHQKLSGASKEQKYPNTVDHWLMELDPRNTGLGRHLNALTQTWKDIQNKLSSADQSLMVCIPSHIALQVTSLLDEWESLRTALKLPGFDNSVDEMVLEQGPAIKAASQPPAIGQTTATVICAPSAWPIAHSPSLDSQSEYRQTVGPIGQIAAQATSPTVARMHHEVEQLTRWLNSVSYFVDNCRVRLGDRFDEETVSRQLQQAKLATKEGSQMDIHQPYHPAALQMKIQQFLTELEARKPQLDRILVEKDRLPVWDREGDEFGSQVTSLPGLWSAAEKTMNERSAELGSMLVDTQKLKDLERDVDRWINKAEAELDGLEFTKESENDPSLPPASHRLFYNQELNHKRIQEIVDSLAEGRNKLALYSKESDSVQARFDSEDSSKLKEDLNELTHRLKNLEDRVMQAQKTAEMQEAMAEKEKLLQLPTLQEQRQQQSTLERLSPRENISEKLENIEQQLNRVSAMESDLRRRDAATAGSAASVDHRAQLISELQNIQADLNNLSGFVGGNIKPMSSEMSAVPDGELLSRWKQLRDKMNTLRQSIQSNHNQNSLFLAKLKDLNNWVAHRDAAFREIVCPLHGDILFILKLRESMLNLLKELETNRAQIEDVLSHGRARYGEEHSDSNLPGELEPESESSDLAGGKSHPEGDGLPTSTTTEEHAKRTVRRIRRYLYYLKKRWINLNTSMLDYKQQLDMISERLTNFQSLFGDAIEQVRSARNVSLRWAPVECIPTDRLASEMEQAQSFYEACEPLTLLISNLDRQINQFQESHVIIDANVIAQLSATRNELEQVRFLTKNRVHVINQTLASIQAAGQRIQPIARTPVMRMPTEIGRSPVSNLELLQTASGAVSPAQVPAQVPLADSVSPPWERCVHPSGTQVPYYKNHATQETQWDHPILDELMQSMKQLNVIRFAEYRTTLKLRRLQKTLCLDSLSISIIAESLKYIGHSQLIEGANTDPFDRTINIPQIIDCLLQLFGRANASYGQNLSDFSAKYSDFCPTDQAEFSASPSKNSTPSRCSTLPPSAKQSMKNSSQKSGCAVIRSTSATREKHPADEFAENRLSTGQGPIKDSKLTEGDRSSSLPGQMVSGGVSPEHRQQRHRRSLSKARRHYVLGPTKHPVNVCVDLTLNWLLNVYDRMRKGTIRALSFKVAITILSVANLDDKYRYLFSLIADSNGCVDEQRLSALLYECILIPKNLGENGWFGKEDFPATVKLCFNQVLEIAKGSERYQGASPLRSEAIPVRHFLTWLRFAPPTLMWIPLLHRVMLAEQVIHHVRCAVCQKQPLIGLRYRCLRCFNLDLCQQCFFSGRTARNHKLSHPMQEYCSNSTSGDSFRDFTRIVRNRFRSKDRIRRPKISSVIQAKHGGSGWTRSARARCCETGSFGEDKPRPAPTFDSEFSTFVPPDSLAETPRVRAKLLKANSFDNAERAANVAASLPPPPQSSQAVPLPENRLPPRAASDNRQLLSEVRYSGLTASRPPFANETPLGLISPNGAGEPIAEDEHRLIAEYSRELRQQSEPELQSPAHPTQVAVSSIGQTLMDRSTISDGLPVTAPLVNEHPLQPFTGHLSLDRRQLGRSPGHGILPYNGYVNGSAFEGGIDQYGRYSAYEQQQQIPMRMDAQLGYRPAGKLNFPMASNPSLLRETTPFEAYAPGIQRSYSLRARSQPPSESHLQTLRQGIIAPPQDQRSLWYQPNYSAQPVTCQATNQTIRSLEEESRALQLEYDRLRQRAMSPGTQASSYAAASRLQAQQAQQRFAQMQMQYPPVIRQQPDFSRSRGLSPRVSLQRPPSASPLLSNAPLYSGLPSIPGRISYTGSLGRAYSASNGFAYPNENFSTDPRLTAYPYRIDGPLDLSVPIPVPGEIAAEARLLREHKGRLEARMQQLEDHNRQLEQQLQRLRQYLVAGGASGAAGGSLGSTTKVSSDIVNTGPKPTLRQRSASGGLAGQLNIGDGQNHVTGGSFGQLPVTETNEVKERIPAPIYSPPPASTTGGPRLKPADQNLPTNAPVPPLTVSDQRRLFPNML